MNTPEIDTYKAVVKEIAEKTSEFNRTIGPLTAQRNGCEKAIVNYHPPKGRWLLRGYAPI